MRRLLVCPATTLYGTAADDAKRVLALRSPTGRIVRAA
jgi:hypothetical protein